MYKSINVLPISTTNLNSEQKSTIVDLAISMNEAANNIYKLTNIFNSSTTTIGIYKLIYKLEEILLTLNIINTIEPSIYDIREQSIGTKEVLSIKEHSIRMFNNEKGWITSYGSLGYYLGFITAKNASYLSPSEQSYYSNLCLLKLYPDYKDLLEAIVNEDKFYDEFIYNYISELIRKIPEMPVVIRHLKILNEYNLKEYGSNYLLSQFKKDQHIELIFQTLSTNYMYFLQEIYKAVQEDKIPELIGVIPLEETYIDPIKLLYDYNEALLGPGGIHTLIVLLASTLIRRAHYLCNIDYVNNATRIEDLIDKATSLLLLSPLTMSIGEKLAMITTNEIEQYDNKL
jgi:hypothetical protein